MQERGFGNFPQGKIDLFSMYHPSTYPLCMYLSVHPSIHPSVYLSTYPPTHPWIHPSTHPPNHPFMDSTIHSPAHPPRGPSFLENEVSVGPFTECGKGDSGPRLRLRMNTSRSDASSPSSSPFVMARIGKEASAHFLHLNAISILSTRGRKCPGSSYRLPAWFYSLKG